MAEERKRENKQVEVKIQNLVKKYNEKLQVISNLLGITNT